MIEPELITGGLFKDHRGAVFYNNEFDASQIKRIYIIENLNTSTVRGWQGHRIEQKWMAALSGKFKIALARIPPFVDPDRDAEIVTYMVSAANLDVLHIPSGFASCIQAMEEHSRLLVMADYHAGEVDDELRFDEDYFNNFSK